MNPADHRATCELRSGSSVSDLFGFLWVVMKSSFMKLRGFALHKIDAKEKRVSQPPAQLDELARASQDMEDMRNCYDSLLSAAAGAANSAYEFSESLREMGACLLEKTALNDDGESGRGLLLLGKVHYELQKLVDSYRSHIFQTITTPSESLLNELRIVGEMKRQCDQKRSVYEDMLAAQREKKRYGKGESIPLQQVQTALDEYDEEATLFVFRLKSLKQGQSRSLLTQAARHYAAQLSFFRKALKSLEAIEPHVKLVTERQHIDYQFSGLEEDDGEDGDGNESCDPHDDGELSFDYGQTDQGQNISMARSSMKLDPVELSFSQLTKTDHAQENIEKGKGDLHFFSMEPRPGSQSAPIFEDRKFEPAEGTKKMQPSSTRKFHTYVLPTPIDAKNLISDGSNIHTRQKSLTGCTHNLWHSSPLEAKKHGKVHGDESSGSTILKAHSVLKESNSDSIRLPPPLAEGLSQPHLDLRTASDNKKIRRQSFSGPLTSKQFSTKAVPSVGGSITSLEHPQLASGMLLHVSIHQPSSSPKVSPTTSPPRMSSPKISELHELPRPPITLTTKPARSSSLTGHSAPLVSRNQESFAMNKMPMAASTTASPLPTPPVTVSRSFSIPSSDQRAMALHVSKILEIPQKSEKAEDIFSPPLTPISLTNNQQATAVTRAGQIRGGGIDLMPTS